MSGCYCYGTKMLVANKTNLTRVFVNRHQTQHKIFNFKDIKFSKMTLDFFITEQVNLYQNFS